MSLDVDLAKARTEEDVKDIYIKYLNLKAVRKNLIDIQTEEIWFETKLHQTNVMQMYAQLLCCKRSI